MPAKASRASSTRTRCRTPTTALWKKESQHFAHHRAIRRSLLHEQVVQRRPLQHPCSCGRFRCSKWYSVDLLQHPCSCGRFQYSEVRYGHTIAVIRAAGRRAPRDVIHTTWQFLRVALPMQSQWYLLGLLVLKYSRCAART